VGKHNLARQDGGNCLEGSTEQGVDKTHEALKQARRQGRFDFDDVAIDRQNAQNKVHVKEPGDMSTGRGAGSGRRRE
jgi:hypothetical protein